MMVEQPFGLPQYKNKDLKDFLNNYIDHPYSQHGNCESSSLTLCWYLSDISCYAAQIGGHTFVLFDQKLWIDLNVGIIISKDFSMFQKLKNYNSMGFEEFWGSKGKILTSNFIFTLIRVAPVRKLDLKKLKKQQ